MWKLVLLLWFDVSRLAPGTYTLTTHAQDRMHIARFVKQ